jgi:hypothetical protein
MLLVCLACTSCSVLVDKDRVQCSVDLDCADRAAGAVCVDSICQPDPVWGCLGNVPFPPAPAGGPYTVTIHLRDLITGGAIPGVTGRLCAQLDASCATPLGPEIEADAAGDLSLQVTAGFNGYAEMHAPGMMPGLYYFYPPVAADRDIPYVPLMPPQLIAQLARLNGKALHEERGHILLGAYDCRRKPNEGIHLSTGADHSDDETGSFYVLNNVPKTGEVATDLSGRGGFINLQEGIVAITANLAADGRKIATVSLFVRRGTITYTSIVPSP